MSVDPTEHDLTNVDEELEEPATEREPERREVLVQSRVFLGIGAVVTVMAVIYISTAYEAAGSVMLVLAAGLSFVCGGYLVFYLRQPSEPAGALEHGDEQTPRAQYLPHASIWPFWIGLAAFLVTNGLILGTWFLVPGAVLMVAALCGFIIQTRARS